MYASFDQNSTAKVLKRSYERRVFVNRNMYMHNIKFFGFDMDYTLAEYISPNLEKLIIKYATNILINEGYPREIEKIEFDPEFSARGLVFDTSYGNFLKIDPYGNILLAVHGLQYIEPGSLTQQYPSRFINVGNTKRYIILNTLFELPLMYLLSWLIDYFTEHPGWDTFDTHFINGYHKLSFLTLYSDVESAINRSHQNSCIKAEIASNMPFYIYRKIDLVKLLFRLRKHGKRTFIATNSDYWYTNTVMTYLFDFAPEQMRDGSEQMPADWKDYFDIIVVSAGKPLFFGEGTKLCQIDLSTNKPSLGIYTGRMNQGCVYQGGNSEIVAEMLGARGSDILYVGDHIFGDILKSKKKQGWRTFLVVPELRREISVWRHHKEYFDNVAKYEAELSVKFSQLDSSARLKVNIEDISRNITDSVTNLEACYGNLGSLLRCGSQITFFASQLSRFADLYAPTCLNLLHYPFDYFYRSPSILMPHESTVEQHTVYEFSSDSLSNLVQQHKPMTRQMEIVAGDAESSNQRQKTADTSSHETENSSVATTTTKKNRRLSRNMTLCLEEDVCNTKKYDEDTQVD